MNCICKSFVWVINACIESRKSSVHTVFVQHCKANTILIKMKVIEKLVIDTFEKCANKLLGIVFGTKFGNTISSTLQKIKHSENFRVGTRFANLTTVLI